MKMRLVLELIDLLNENPKIARRVKMLATLGVFCFLAISSFVIWGLFQVIDFVAILANEFHWLT